ncbi:MAG TPA: metal ABC transporter substrate-binding protein [Roseiflexaceae bacterium]|nr:metal ABC transporter substrate-binding protein [Roseiflexaceae bacterium]
MRITTIIGGRLCFHRRFALLLVGALLVPLLAACGVQQSGGATAAPEPAQSARIVKVVTTMSILADMVEQVGGERVAAENIIPIGAGPEDYQPTPQDAQKIAGADIVFYNGHGLEEWLGDLFRSAAKPNQPQIAVSDGLQALDVGSGDFKQGNPHFWMSAALGAKYVEKIRDGLIQVDPAGKAAYTASADAYARQLVELNEELKRQAATIPAAERKMVTNHDAFPYFAQEYGFTIVGNLLSTPESEPSAGELAALVQAIKAQNVKAIFSETQFSPKLTKTIADEAGVTIVSSLYTDTLGEAGSGVTTYIDMLRYDMQEVIEALK